MKKEYTKTQLQIYALNIGALKFVKQNSELKEQIDLHTVIGE
jgi:hypothetical protein